jgi:hypothetical protein
MLICLSFMLIHPRSRDDWSAMTHDYPWTPVDPLGEALHLLRMSGVFYCRTEATAPWALEMPAFADCLSFHVVTAGGCWLGVDGAEALYLRAGDLALVPHGRGHRLLSQPGVTPAGRVDQLPQQRISEHYSILRHGGGGAPSTLVCGIVSFHDPAAQQLIRLLPPVIHTDGSSASSPTWIGDTLRLIAAEVRQLRPGGEAVTTRLADILVIQAIRAWCPVQAKIAKSRIRLRVILRSPDLGCESLPGSGCPAAATSPAGRTAQWWCSIAGPWPSSTRRPRRAHCPAGRAEPRQRPRR